MSESFSFRFHETPAEKFLRRFEETGLTVEVVDAILRAIEELLFTIIETGGDLDPQKLAQLRRQLQALLTLLGLESLEDLPVVLEYLSAEVNKRIIPDWYPTIGTIRTIIYRLYSEAQHASEEVPKTVTAGDVAEFAQVDHELKGRGDLDLAEYLHALGIFMINEYAYKLMIADSDAIKIGEDWKIENGRHRSFVLRIFGKKNVEKIGMDEWVKVEIERPHHTLASARNMLTGKS